MARQRESEGEPTRESFGAYNEEKVEVVDQGPSEGKEDEQKNEHREEESSVLLL